MVVSLIVSGVLAFGYRLYRMRKGGPTPDAVGGAVLAVGLAGVAIAFASGTLWVRWIALGYALLFGLVVTPIWVLAVFIPARPRPWETLVIVAYWISVATVGVSAIAV